MKFQNSLLSYSCLSVQLPSLAISPLSSFLEMRDFLLLFGSCHSAAKPQRLLSCSKKLSGAGGRHSLPLRLPDLLCFMGVGGGWTGTTTQLLPRDWCRLSAALWKWDRQYSPRSDSRQKLGEMDTVYLAASSSGIGWQLILAGNP